MATPKVRNNPNESHDPAIAAPVDSGNAPVSDWFAEFEQVEKVFSVLGGMILFAMLVAHLGARIENNAVLIAGTVVLSLALVGVASLFIPLNWILIKEFLARRRRALKRTQNV